MAGSFLAIKSVKSDLIRNQEISCASQKSNIFNLIFVIPFILISIAIFSVPDRPDYLASICEKHHSEIACSVW